MKSEPGEYALADLAADGRTDWEGVRNYQARNYMRDEMRVGDQVLFYHSNARPSGVVGRARISRTARPDRSALDPASAYYDPRSTPEKPIWVAVELAYEETFARILSLAEIKADPVLGTMLVARKGMRLSIQPVEPPHLRRVCEQARSGGPGGP